MSIALPACAPCLAGDHTHCRNWVDVPEQHGLDYCKCFWRNHLPV